MNHFRTEGERDTSCIHSVREVIMKVEVYWRVGEREERETLGILHDHHTHLHMSPHYFLDQYLDSLLHPVQHCDVLPHHDLRVRRSPFEL